MAALGGNLNIIIRSNSVLAYLDGICALDDEAGSAAPLPLAQRVTRLLKRSLSGEDLHYCPEKSKAHRNRRGKPLGWL